VSSHPGISSGNGQKKRFVELVSMPDDPQMAVASTRGGSVPLNRFQKIDKFPRLGDRSAGTVPLSKLLDRVSRDRGRPVRASGMVPDKDAPPRPSSEMFERDGSKTELMVPDSAEGARSRCERSVSTEREVGIEPDKCVPPTSSRASRVSCDMLVGRVPDKPVVPRPNSSRLLITEMSGIDPESEEALALKNLRLDKPFGTDPERDVEEKSSRVK